MTDLQTLTVLLGHNERQRDLALAEHQRAQNASVAATAQAEQLLVYRREYEQRWSAQFRREGQIELVRCYQSFIERLNQAVEQQTRIAEHSGQQVARTLAAMQAVEMRCASVRKLIERRTLELRRDADRRDQKHSDESAARSGWNALDANAQARSI